MPAATVAARASETTSGSTAQKVDVAVVGAGFAGLYLLNRLRKAGLACGIPILNIATTYGPALALQGFQI
jgi:hypothetical protein